MTDAKTVAELAAKGTQGEWGFHPIYDITSVVAGDRLVASTGGYQSNADPNCRADNEANAQRIANVPAMEALIADLSTRNAELEAENARLGEALVLVINCRNGPKEGLTDFGEREHFKDQRNHMIAIARAALQGEQQ